MSRSRINHKSGPQLRAVCAGLVLIAAGTTFSALGAKKIGLKTAVIRMDGEQKVMPYDALLYDSKGRAFAYTSPKPLTFVRKEIKVERMDGDRVGLAEGPPAGTRVVTTGNDEVYGTEVGVEGE